jgi:rhomboid protease GluP
MVGSGVSIFSPTGIDIIKWGANFGPLTLSGDWWRLISCVFVHIGIIHIAFNMYALYMAGVYLEPLLGKTKYIAAYLCTGVFASLASLWWHKDPIASAGASGAIFGMYGIFLALLSTNLIPKQIRKGLLQSIGVFVIYNLVYGIKSGVDNSAHIGGLLSGLLIGYLYYPGLKSPGKKSLTLVGVIAVATAGSTIFYLQNNKAADETRSRAKEEIEEYEYKDADKYREQLKIFGEAEKKALAPFGDTTLTYQEKVEKLQSFSLPEWEKASEAIERIKSLKVSDKSKQKGEKVQQYISLRKEEIRLIGQLALKEDEGMATQLEAVKNKIHQLIVELKGL